VVYDGGSIMIGNDKETIGGRMQGHRKLLRLTRAKTIRDEDPVGKSQWTRERDCKGHEEGLEGRLWPVDECGNSRWYCCPRWKNCQWSVQALLLALVLLLLAKTASAQEAAALMGRQGQEVFLNNRGLRQPGSGVGGGGQGNQGDGRGRGTLVRLEDRLQKVIQDRMGQGPGRIGVNRQGVNTRQGPNPTGVNRQGVNPIAVNRLWINGQGQNLGVKGQNLGANFQKGPNIGINRQGQLGPINQGLPGHNGLAQRNQGNNLQDFVPSRGTASQFVPSIRGGNVDFASPQRDGGATNFVKPNHAGNLASPPRVGPNANYALPPPRRGTVEFVARKTGVPGSLVPQIGGSNNGNAQGNRNQQRPFGQPEIFFTNLPSTQVNSPIQMSESFENFDEGIDRSDRIIPNRDQRDQTQSGSFQQEVPQLRPEFDWSAKVSETTDNKQVVNLDTKYFTYPETGFSITADPGSFTRPTKGPFFRPTPGPFTQPTTTRPVLVLRKVKGRLKTTTSDPVQSLSYSTEKKYSDICEGSIIECEKNEVANNTSAIIEVDDLEEEIQSLFAGYEDLAKHFKQEIWVIPILVAAAIIILILTIFEIFLLSKSINKNPSRRHLFLGQMLLGGLLACAGMSVVYTLQPTPVTCAVIRLGTGLSYSLIYSTLLVKLVFLISLNSGVYLPATYQSLLLCFAILIQLVIGIQWLVSAPPDITDVTLQSGMEMITCTTIFKQQLLGLLYVVFLIIVVVILAFKSRGVRENYREAMYVGLTMSFTVAIWIVWILAGLIVPDELKDVCSSCGLIACTSITFVIMFMPKGRQLSAMGKEGVYAEDRTDVYMGSGTGSTGSSGTPSPSFFPVKSGKLAQTYREKEREFKERAIDRERLDTPPTPRKHMHHVSSRLDDNIYSSLDALSGSADKFQYKSKQSRSNPNVMFRRPNDMPSQIIY